MLAKNAQNIDDFIKSCPKSTRLILEKIRTTISNVAPEATEAINYGIPTFKISGKNLIHFSAYQNHIGIYPGSEAIVEFSDELKYFKTSKGTIKLPLDKPIPYDLINKITHFRIQALRSKQ